MGLQAGTAVERARGDFPEEEEEGSAEGLEKKYNGKRADVGPLWGRWEGELRGGEDMKGCY